jgi:hypothetical protein
VIGMRKLLLLPALIGAMFFAGCYTAEEACEDHGGLRPGSVEIDNDGGAEARCNDNTEIESDDKDPNSKSWMADS